MKHLVDKNKITGWRKSGDREKDTIEVFKRDLRVERIGHEVSIGVAIILSVAMIKFGNVILGDSPIRTLLITLLVVSASVYVIYNNVKKLITNCKIAKAIENGKFDIEDCYINSIDHKMNTDDIKPKVDRLAYIHNDLDEYCTEPIEVTEEIEESTKRGLEPKFIILKIENGIYKILELLS